jgi:hypothetical protein|tara:strand:+ start:95 stop:496 length:402 start_codon:yes stop_codon:yes gene_type:complete
MAYALKDLNKAAAAHNLELVKGDGYFYWVHPEQVDIPSVYVAAFSHGDRAFWEAELIEAAYGAEAPATEEEKQFFCQTAQWGSDRAYALNDIRETLKLHDENSAYFAKLMAERDALINEMALECAAEYKRLYK